MNGLQELPFVIVVVLNAVFCIKPTQKVFVEMKLKYHSFQGSFHMFLLSRVHTAVCWNFEFVMHISVCLTQYPTSLYSNPVEHTFSKVNLKFPLCFLSSCGCSFSWVLTLWLFLYKLYDYKFNEISHNILGIEKIKCAFLKCG